MTWIQYCFPNITWPGTGHEKAITSCNVQHRISFKILILAFKAIHGLAPDYISDLITVNSTYSLRLNNGLLLTQPSVILKKTIGDRWFTAAAPSLWNKLPSCIRNMTSLDSFKSSLKTFLFRLAFNENT
jgi:hypothetical protein